jgi:hypothetical protein
VEDKSNKLPQNAKTDGDLTTAAADAAPRATGTAGAAAVTTGTPARTPNTATGVANMVADAEAAKVPIFTPADFAEKPGDDEVASS